MRERVKVIFYIFDLLLSCILERVNWGKAKYGMLSKRFNSLNTERKKIIRLTLSHLNYNKSAADNFENIFIKMSEISFLNEN